MSAGRRLAAVLTVVGVALLTTGSGAFTAAQLDRGVDVSVVEDEEAFLAVEELDPAPEADANSSTDHVDVELVQLTNQFTAQDLTVAVDIDERSSGPDATSEPTASSVSSGETETVTVDVECPAGSSNEDWSVDITAEGEGVEIQLTRTVEVSCVES
jgi:uncharacterized membrane protein